MFLRFYFVTFTDKAVEMQTMKNVRQVAMQSLFMVWF